MRLLLSVLWLIISIGLIAAEPSKVDSLIHAKVHEALKEFLATQPPPPKPLGEMILCFVGKVQPGEKEKPVVLQIARSEIAPSGGTLRFQSMSEKGMATAIGEYQIDKPGQLTVDGAWMIDAQFFDPFIQQLSDFAGLPFQDYRVRTQRHTRTFSRGTPDIMAVTKIVAEGDGGEVVSALALVVLWR